MLAYLDTQVVVWLASGYHQHISIKARCAINAAGLLLSPMVGLELQYLNEIGRLRIGATEILDKLKREIDLRICDQPFASVTAASYNEAWTRDPFDRIIVAQAKANGLSQLITADEKIHKHYVNAIW